MSRQIDVSNAEALTDEDRKYLADRSRTLDQERERQDAVQLAADIATGDADSFASRIVYANRTGQTSAMAPMFVRRSGAAV